MVVHVIPKFEVIRSSYAKVGMVWHQSNVVFIEGCQKCGDLSYQKMYENYDGSKEDSSFLNKGIDILYKSTDGW